MCGNNVSVSTKPSGCPHFSPRKVLVLLAGNIGAFLCPRPPGEEKYQSGDLGLMSVETDSSQHHHQHFPSKIHKFLFSVSSLGNQTQFSSAEPPLLLHFQKIKTDSTKWKDPTGFHRQGQFLQGIQHPRSRWNLTLGSIHVFFLTPGTSKIWARTVIPSCAVQPGSRKRYLFFLNQSILRLAT